MDNLFILLFLPVLSAIILAFIKSSSARWAALLLSLIQLGLTVPFLCNFIPDASVQFAQSFTWIESLGIKFQIGIDGISLPMLILTNGLIPLIILASFAHNKSGNFYALISFMQAGLVLVFISLDAFSFYVGWEAALIPIYFICALWGDGDRIRVNLKFFIYTFFGSLLMLIAIIYLYQQTGTNDLSWSTLTSLKLTESAQTWVFWAFFIAFAIKIPLFPLHTWQPDTYTHAPAAGTMLLSGIMLKMGLFGLLRWLLPLVPNAVAQYGTLAMTLSIIGVVYGSLIAFKLNDAKRLIAYSSIAHVGLISAGIFSLTQEGIQGAIIQMVNHGISVVGLFFVIDIIQQRTGSRNFADLGGLASRMPILATCFLIIIMGAIGLPLTNGFIGEFLLLKGIFAYPVNGVWFAVFGGTTLILGAVYMLRLFQKTMLGNISDSNVQVKDINGVEVLVLVLIVALVIVIGILPNMLLNISEASVSQLLQQIK
ncbi:NADH-quinone oxidoreductase subunit M [Sphingobacterium sp. DK4209]|uniref:NADH-quinone oxidoreductase subunit M n=1 Tax=Sphingobacterium zhuxiongii TaxID=2662364 RepID=A0A5Q0QFD3_9SPHI|nr:MULTISPECIES: NADH-quinone oxidoreductase subunit M [unclassified Sphingobacterium]MVZ66764.1 NADH-quinone oxidoreductase subunit M [Sphingobacterium sp. DK4209]QGA27999.1 NADH-quinone oxidoreductase subunit M [Sphingobacterium sp. dk4302]